LACVAALRGRKDAAFSLLREAVDNGLAPETDLNMEKDTALEPIHGDPRFEAVVSHAKDVAAAAQKPK